MYKATPPKNWRNLVVVSGLGLGTLILIALTFLSFDAAQRLQDATEWRTHSTEVVAAAAQVLERVVSAETAQRGYLSTSDTLFLDNFQQAYSEVPDDLDALAFLIRDNHEQSRRFIYLKDEIKTFLKYLQTTMHHFERGEKNPQRVRFVLQEGQEKAERVRLLHSEFLKEENHLLLVRTQDQQEKFKNLSWLMPLGLVTGLSLMIFAMVMLYQEMRRRARVEEELNLSRLSALDASVAKSSFLANMSHEIRTPMNGILGMTELMDHTPLNTEQQEYLHAIQDSSKALLVLVNDILDISKIEAGKLELEKTDFSLRQMTDSLKGVFEYTSMAKNIPLIVELDSDIPDHLIGDALRLRQVLVNLIGNAFKFSSQGVIRLAIARLKSPGSEKAQLSFTVEDQGIGFSEEVGKKLFSAFSQADVSTTRKFGGTGLGLAISKQLIDMMGGNLAAASELGKGSRFYFDITLEISAKVASPETTGPTNTQSLQALTRASILIVEDNLVNQKVAQGMLKKMGHNFEIANDGVEALALLREKTYDLVLMDGHMPNMDGYQTTEKIRSEATPYFDIPIIATTANAIKGEREKALDIGMDDYISKPMSYEDLFRKIEGILRAHERLPRAAAEWLDLKAVHEFYRRQSDNKEAALKAVDILTANTRADLKQLQMAAQNGNVFELKDKIPSLQASASSVGLEKLSELLQKMEVDLPQLPERDRFKLLNTVERCALISFKLLRSALESL